MFIAFSQFEYYSFVIADAKKSIKYHPKKLISIWKEISNDFIFSENGKSW